MAEAAAPSASYYVVIIGGGPAGLSAAGRFHELGIAATVLEREQQAGGSFEEHCERELTPVGR